MEYTLCRVETASGFGQYFNPATTPADHHTSSSSSLILVPNHQRRSRSPSREQTNFSRSIALRRFFYHSSFVSCSFFLFLALATASFHFRFLDVAAAPYSFPILCSLTGFSCLLSRSKWYVVDSIRRKISCHLVIITVDWNCLLKFTLFKIFIPFNWLLV